MPPVFIGRPVNSPHLGQNRVNSSSYVLQFSILRIKVTIIGSLRTWVSLGERVKVTPERGCCSLLLRSRPPVDQNDWVQCSSFLVFTPASVDHGYIEQSGIMKERSVLTRSISLSGKLIGKLLLETAVEKMRIKSTWHDLKWAQAMIEFYLCYLWLFCQSSTWTCKLGVLHHLAVLVQGPQVQVCCYNATCSVLLSCSGLTR